MKYILYADDDADDREMMEEMFVIYPDHTLLTFRDGQHLLTHLAETTNEAVCLVVLDVNMPLLDGISTLVQIRQELQIQELPVILYTTSSSPVDRVRAESLKAKVITKPVSYNQMQEVAEEMIGYCMTHKAR